MRRKNEDISPLLNSFVQLKRKRILMKGIGYPTQHTNTEIIVLMLKRRDVLRGEIREERI